MSDYISQEQEAWEFEMGAEDMELYSMRQEAERDLALEWAHQEAEEAEWLEQDKPLALEAAMQGIPTVGWAPEVFVADPDAADEDAPF